MKKTIETRIEQNKVVLIAEIGVNYYGNLRNVCFVKFF